MNIFKRIAEMYTRWKHRRALKKRIKELRKRDPFIY